MLALASHSSPGRSEDSWLGKSARERRRARPEWLFLTIRPEVTVRRVCRSMIKTSAAACQRPRSRVSCLTAAGHHHAGPRVILDQHRAPGFITVFLALPINPAAGGGSGMLTASLLPRFHPSECGGRLELISQAGSGAIKMAGIQNPDSEGMRRDSDFLSDQTIYILTS